jgi:hypothetical protein
MDRSGVGGKLAHSREQHVVLLVDVLVQIELERGKRLDQRAVLGIRRDVRSTSTSQAGRLQCRRCVGRGSPTSLPLTTARS